MINNNAIPMVDCPNKWIHEHPDYCRCGGIGKVVDLDRIWLALALAEKRCHQCAGMGDNPLDKVCGNTGKVPMFKGLRVTCLEHALAKQLYGVNLTACHECQGRGWLPLTGAEAMVVLMQTIPNIAGGVVDVGTIPIEISARYSAEVSWFDGHYGRYEHPDPVTALACVTWLAFQKGDK